MGPDDLEIVQFWFRLLEKRLPPSKISRIMVSFRNARVPNQWRGKIFVKKKTEKRKKGGSKEKNSICLVINETQKVTYFS